MVSKRWFEEMEDGLKKRVTPSGKIKDRPKQRVDSFSKELKI
jgi:hypothetical protein